MLGGQRRRGQTLELLWRLGQLRRMGHDDPGLLETGEDVLVGVVSVVVAVVEVVAVVGVTTTHVLVLTVAVVVVVVAAAVVVEVKVQVVLLREELVEVLGLRLQMETRHRQGYAGVGCPHAL